jgi:hypothetical protein
MHQIGVPEARYSGLGFKKALTGRIGGRKNGEVIPAGELREQPLANGGRINLNRGVSQSRKIRCLKRAEQTSNQEWILRLSPSEGHEEY